eukprot:CAMPEP_0115318644 /NCGR_PEP_ID=MMETSP0270-20121206/79316_1 /TAXON_ID=71861 /ORGANISM="Scrippsiella trochoidea, Strain CCMP3099" /LENGTH=417 /DNA_ID=CAMNT_0002738231 /DNA_START=1 /DNA_END=1251 /DNA_ORIENTATION=-
MRAKCSRCAGELLRRFRLLDLRFSDKDEEAAFVASREAHARFILKTTIFAGLSAGVVQLKENLPMELFRGGDAASSLKWSDPRVIFIISFVQFWIGVCLAVLVYMLSRCRRSCMTKMSAEHLWVFVAAYAAISLSLARKWNWKAIMEDAGTIEACDLTIVSFEATTFLMQDMVVTVLCVCAPMRLHLMVIPVAFAWLSLAGVTLAFGSPDPESSPGQLFILFALSACGLQGAWKNERHRRFAWIQARALDAQQTELSSATELATGMQAILQRLCDVVLTMGPDLRVCDQELSHQSFFGHAVHGELFSSMVSVHDQERFSLLIAQATCLQLPQCIHLTLVRDTGSFDAEVLAVATGSGAQQYILGVKADLPLNTAVANIEPEVSRMGVISAHVPHDEDERQIEVASVGRSYCGTMNSS